MKHGRFDDTRREYVIHTPETPYPWINYLGNDRFFALISNTAGGYCFHIGPHGLPLIGRADWNDCLNLNCFIDVVNHKPDGTVRLEVVSGKGKTSGTRVQANKREKSVRLIATVN